MSTFKKPQSILIFYGNFIAIAAVSVLVNMLLSPSESGSALAFGLSAPRLLMAVGLFAAFILFSRLALKAFREPIWAENFLAQWFGGGGLSQRLLWLSGISFILSWIGCFLPTYRLGVLVNYWVRVQPVISFILFAGLVTLVVFLVVRVKRWNFAAFRPGVLLFVFSLIMLGNLLYSKFGIISSEDFWYGTGIPILTSQLLVVVISGILFLQIGSTWTSKRSDLLTCVLLYILTAWLWVREPLQKSFLMIGPYWPNRVLYPFADAAVFDTASQFSLIGQKIFIFNTFFFERPLYLSFLTYLHVVFGQDYLLLMAIQAVIFAILPVLIYLIGRSMNMRAVGVAAALVTMFRGLNAIAASNLIDTAGPKMMLTDFPTAIGIAIITFLMCEWLKDKERKAAYAIWVGGVSGFTVMLRTNALLLLAFIPFYALFVFMIKNWRQWIFSVLLIVLGAVSITLPWELRNLSLGEQMYQPIVSKFQSVIQQRYPTLQPTPSSFNPMDPSLDVALLSSTQAITALQQTRAASQNTIPCNSIICFSANHFLHNIVTSVLVLPTSPMLDDLRHLIKERSPYWQTNWDGNISGSALVLLCLNLFFISTGIVLAWRKQRFTGLIPLVIFLIYNLSNALARTSGGRYLVPLDWIPVIYYLLGVFHIITWLANDLEIPWSVFSTQAEPDFSTKENFYTKSFGAFVALLLFGSLLPLSEHLQPPRYQNQDPLAILNENSTQLAQAGFTQDALHEFLQSPNAKVLLGRALYPRYYKVNQGEFVNAFYPYQTLGYPRTAFRLIGPAGDYGVILPMRDAPDYFPHTGDTLVVGCNGQNYLDALLVIVLNNHNIIYIRKPAAATLQCPLPEPVCNNNSVCK
jgi:hypothetical protein